MTWTLPADGIGFEITGECTGKARAGRSMAFSKRLIAMDPDAMEPRELKNDHPYELTFPATEIRDVIKWFGDQVTNVQFSAKRNAIKFEGFDDHGFIGETISPKIESLPQGLDFSCLFKRSLLNVIAQVADLDREISIFVSDDAADEERGRPLPILFRFRLHVDNRSYYHMWVLPLMTDQ